MFRWIKANSMAVSARAAAALVALIAGAASWEHIASVAHAAGERRWVANALPLAIDGLIVVGVAALLEDKKLRRIPRMSARVAVVIGVLATLAANVASAEPNWTARAVAVAAPVSFLLSIEVLTRTGRQRPEAVVEAAIQPEPTPQPPQKKKNAQRVTGAAAQRVVEILKQDADAAKNIHQLARRAGVSWGTARRVVDAEMS